MKPTPGKTPRNASKPARKHPIDQGKTTLELLEETIQLMQARPPLRARLWGGADVVISVRPLPPQPPDRWNAREYTEVVTPHGHQLSWLFERLRDIFGEGGLLGGMNKYPFYGRMANAANRCIAEGHRGSFALMLAVLYEAFVMYDEAMYARTHNRRAPTAASIVSDKCCIYRNHEQALTFFKERGIEM
jgi:hypothetical protein